ncbi:MAG: hypothetical protein PHV34_01100 [Verrucomicrobiae bacterium]|nr:hypothetical protein [Verrucomicrobiae bacterium]
MSSKEDLFAMTGEKNILAPEHLGVMNGRLTVNTPHSDVFLTKGLFAPPYASSDFVLSVSLDGKTIQTMDYVWNVFEIQRKGRFGDIEIETDLFLPCRRRAMVLSVSMRNKTAAAKSFSLGIALSGTLDYLRFWGFSKPKSVESCVVAHKGEPDGLSFLHRADERLLQGRKIVFENASGSIAVGADRLAFSWDKGRHVWSAEVFLKGRQRLEWNLAVAIGDHREASLLCDEILSDVPKAGRLARVQHARQVDAIFDRLPALEAEDSRLVKFYRRSLSHLILNRWDVPEFKLNPYYSTGSINGGCVCEYLWDFGESAEILSLWDPEALEAHIVQFLSVDLTRHFAFTPITGEGYGPWYPVNQEKILSMIFFYLLHTGNVDFLEKRAGGRSVWEWVLMSATHGDDLNRPVRIMDYGAGNNHLELRKEHRYDHYLPDLNGRRHGNYMLAYRISVMAGKRAEFLRKRALAIKKMLKEKFWSARDKWFHYLDKEMKPHLRYTVQMYYLLGAGVLDQEEEQGLLSHLNPEEFLSEHGLHSMAKHDPAYDEADIDNGGPGSCTCFSPQIIERLYQCGQGRLAGELLARILWWGERLPYWGDSQVAARMDYRRDTPLICDIDGVTGAQSIIFGLFGVRMNEKRSVAIHPQAPSFSPTVALRGLKLGGMEMDIVANGKTFTVHAGRKKMNSPDGKPLNISLFS